MIEAFASPPRGSLTFMEISTAVNSPNADLLVATYSDEAGAIYSVDSSYRIVEFQASPIRSLAGEPLPVDRLRQIAEDLAFAALPVFDQASHALLYQEGQKEDVYFFRWEDTSRAWTHMPPMFQVGIQGDGQLLSYINTIFLP